MSSASTNNETATCTTLAVSALPKPELPVQWHQALKLVKELVTALNNTSHPLHSVASTLMSEGKYPPASFFAKALLSAKKLHKLAEEHRAHVEEFDQCFDYDILDCDSNRDSDDATHRLYQMAKAYAPLAVAYEREQTALLKQKRKTEKEDTSPKPKKQKGEKATTPPDSPASGADDEDAVAAAGDDE